MNAHRLKNVLEYIEIKSETIQIFQAQISYNE